MSCMVSQQVITPNAQVVILPIVQQATYNPVVIAKEGKETSQYGVAHSTCYPTAFWGYSGPIVRGVYDDYGCFKLDDTNENKFNLVMFFKYLMSKAFETKKGENPYHEHGFNIHTIFDSKKEYCFEELVTIWNCVWEVAQENRLFVNDHGHPRNLTFTVMHRAAADYLINSVNASVSYDGQSYEQKTYFTNYVRNEFKRTVKVFKDKKELSDIYSFYIMQLANFSNYGIGDQEGCYLGQHYDNFNEVMDIMETYSPKDGEEIPNELIDKIFKVFKSQIDHRYIHRGLDNFNVKLAPMASASQDYDNTIGQNYMKMIKAISSKVTKETKKNYDD